MEAGLDQVQCFNKSYCSSDPEVFSCVFDKQIGSLSKLLANERVGSSKTILLARLNLTSKSKIKGSLFFKMFLYMYTFGKDLQHQCIL